ncbi:MAG: hypothetical protein IJF01_06715 [Tidjanibacter sp.]|nr:hypothetical protein [Tidjanibacter sp.]
MKIENCGACGAFLFLGIKKDTREIISGFAVAAKSGRCQPPASRQSWQDAGFKGLKGFKAIRATGKDRKNGLSLLLLIVAPVAPVTKKDTQE